MSNISPFCLCLFRHILYQTGTCPKYEQEGSIIIKWCSKPIRFQVHIYILSCTNVVSFYFFSDFPWLGIPALTLLAMSGLLVLLTDIQIANLFGTRRYTIMSLFVGSYHSGGLVLFFMKVRVTKPLYIYTDSTSIWLPSQYYNVFVCWFISLW